MNSSWKESVRDLKNMRAGDKFLIAVIAIFLCVCMVVFSLGGSITKAAARYQEIYIETQYYKIGDQFGGNGIDFEAQPGAQSKMRMLHEALKRNEEFTFFEFFSQTSALIGVDQERVPDSFLSGYDSGGSNYPTSYTDPQTGVVSSMRAVESYYIGYEAQEVLDWKMEDGRWFAQEEYDIRSGTLPIVLGGGYEDIFSVGEIIQLGTLYSEMPISGVVIGILEKNSVIPEPEQWMVSLDRIVVLPMLDFGYGIEDVPYEIPQKVFSYMKNRGYIATEHSPEFVQGIVNEMCDNFGISPAYWISNAENVRSGIFQASLTDITVAFLVVAGFASCFIVVIAGAMTIIKISKNRKKYAILLVSGFTMGQLYRIVIWNAILPCSIAYAIGMASGSLISYIFHISLHIDAFIITGVLIIFIIVTSSVVGIIQLSKRDLSLYLNRR